MNDTDTMEARYDVLPLQLYRQRRAGVSEREMQINRAQRTVERLETYLSDPSLTVIDRCYYQGKLGVWRGHLQSLLRDGAR